ncbi:PqqD family protein [Carnobacterium maltaromaticum]|uniref:PqqD family protein n=1 Tax=Carnobacterium maltaromaticum TaxID=2751 RepID=UPI003BEEF3EA
MKLEYFNVNETGAYILYLVSKKCKLDTVVNIFIDQYQIEKKECREIILSFLDDFPLKNIIYHNLIDKDIYLELPPFK